MTLDDIKAITDEFISVRDAAIYLGCGEQGLRISAQKGALPWAYAVGTRTKIPRRAFISYHEQGATFDGKW